MVYLHLFLSQFYTFLSLNLGFLCQGAASPEELVKRLGGSRVITKILIANNGIAAVSFWLFIRFIFFPCPLSYLVCLFICLCVCFFLLFLVNLFGCLLVWLFVRLTKVIS